MTLIIYFYHSKFQTGSGTRSSMEDLAEMTPASVKDDV